MLEHPQETLDAQKLSCLVIRCLIFAWILGCILIYSSLKLSDFSGQCAQQMAIRFEILSAVLASEPADLSAGPIVQARAASAAAVRICVPE